MAEKAGGRNVMACVCLAWALRLACRGVIIWHSALYAKRQKAEARWRWRCSSSARQKSCVRVNRARAALALRASKNFFRRDACLQSSTRARARAAASLLAWRRGGRAKRGRCSERRPRALARSLSFLFYIFIFLLYIFGTRHFSLVHDDMTRHLFARRSRMACT